MSYSGIVYELLDPRDMRCRYVGQTFCLKKRESQHMQRNSYQGNMPLFNWKLELARLSLQPILRVIEDGISPAVINERERFWCEQRSNEGFELLNRPVGSIRKEDLFGKPQRAEIAVSIKELREMLIAIRSRYSLPVHHRINKEYLKCDKALLAFQHAFTDY